jgi:hypothetical protein
MQIDGPDEVDFGGAGSAGVLGAAVPVWPAVPGKIGRQCRGASTGSAGPCAVAVPARAAVPTW